MDHGNGKRYYMIVCFIIVFLGATIFASRAFAFNSFLTEFKTFYSIANGTRLDTCGVCHFNFNGGGSRNPYGQAYTGSSSAINSSNSDGDGSPNGTEASSGFFPGYNCTNYSQASNVPASLTLANFVDPSNVGCVVSNPVPALTSLSPSSAAAGSGAFTLTVNGTGFVSGSVVRWNGADRTTTFVSATRVTASIPASDITTAGTTAQVTVFNPAPGGGTSAALTFTVNSPTNTGEVSVNPADGASDVPVTTVVTVTGDGSADISTVVNENTFSLMEGSPVAMSTSLSESDDDGHPSCVSEGIVNGSVTYNTSNTVATFTPLCPLKGSTTYTATITPPAGVQQSVLAGPMVWSFTTIAMTPDSDDDGDPDAGDDSPKDCRNATPGTPRGNGKITMNLDGHPNGCFKNITATSETVPSVNRTGMPSGLEFQYGILTYEIHGVPPGETDTVTLTYPETFPAGSKVYKVDAGGFHEYTDAVIDGNTVTLRVTDGGKGDMDGTADGKILDPVGVAVPTASGGGSIDLSTGASGGGCSVVGAGGGWKEAAGCYGLIALAWIGLALRRRKPKSGK